MIGKFVLVRTRSAGVHCGYLVEYCGTSALLRESRCVWRWRGANSLNELSLYGCAESHTRISEPVEEASFTEVIQVIPCTAKAENNLKRSRWGA